MVFPTGFIVAAFLSRRLGPVDYGTLAVATSIVIWLETLLPRMFGGAIVTFVAERADWEVAAAAAARIELGCAIALAAALALSAPLLASAMGVPELSGYLRLFSLDLPISELGYIYMLVLNGRQRFGRAAMAGSSYYAGRMVFVLAIVSLVPTIQGALVALLCSSAARLAVARLFIRVPLLRRGFFPIRRVISYSGASVFIAITLPLCDQVGLYLVKTIDPNQAAAGFYSAAGNLSVLPNLVASTLSGVILASMTVELSAGSQEGSRLLVHQCSRLILLLLPVAAVLSACSSEVVALIYGAAFGPAAPMFAILIFAMSAWGLVIVSSGPLIAAGKLHFLPVLYGPLLPLLVGVGYILTARFGGQGAALATLVVGIFGSLVAAGLIYATYGTFARPRTVFNIALATAVVLVIGRLWLAPGPLLVVKGGGLTLLVLGLLVVLGEIGRGEIMFARSVLFGRAST